MAEKSREILLRIYQAISKYRIFLYAAYAMLYAVYIIKNIILTKSVGILRAALIFAALCVLATALPVYRRKFFRAEYVLELAAFPLVCGIMLGLGAMGFAAPDSEVMGLVACAGLYAETVYAIKWVRKEVEY